MLSFIIYLSTFKFDFQVISDKNMVLVYNLNGNKLKQLIRKLPKNTKYIDQSDSLKVVFI